MIVSFLDSPATIGVMSSAATMLAGALTALPMLIADRRNIKERIKNQAQAVALDLMKAENDRVKITALDNNLAYQQLKQLVDNMNKEMTRLSANLAAAEEREAQAVEEVTKLTAEASALRNEVSALRKELRQRNRKTDRLDQKTTEHIKSQKRLNRGIVKAALAADPSLAASVVGKVMKVEACHEQDPAPAGPTA